jgi:GWxTD domain-containing protein
MRKTAAICFFLFAPALFGSDAAELLTEGREHLERKEYAAAVQLFHKAVPDAEKLDPEERKNALAALHFYTAQAFSGLDNDAHTRLELQAFFDLKPAARSVDPGKFDDAFVRRFKEARATFDARGISNFDSFYPGYDKIESPSEVSLAAFADGPEMTLLASPDERQDWTMTSDEASRRRFMDTFWAKRGTGFRREFQRRVSFADAAFSSDGVRGSLTDRGRVFIVLGPPRSIRQSHLTREDAGRGLGKLGIGSPIVRGEVEQWYYGRDQFPKTIAEQQLVFKFVSEAEYGDGILQREPILMRALYEAGHTVR